MLPTVLYLLAIVLANLGVRWAGPGIVPLNAFLFIGLDLTLRDQLHTHWEGSGLRWKMALLIAAGSGLSLLLGAGGVAVASGLSFGVAAVGDALTFHALRQQAPFARVQGSNTVSAVLDSILFPLLAFGLPLDPGVVIGQIAAKLLGGVIWYPFLAAMRWGRATGGAIRGEP